MTVAYPLAFPTARGLREIAIRHRKVVGQSKAPFSRLARQTYEWPSNEWWELSLDLVVQTRADAAPWLAWLMSLDAQVGKFVFGDPAGATPLGAAAATPGTPQVDGGGQTGKTLAIKTGLGTTANYLLAGSWLQLGSGLSTRLYMVVNNASLASDGRAVLDLRPALRMATIDGETITLTAAKGLWSLDQGQIEMAIDNASKYRAATITAAEAPLT